MTKEYIDHPIISTLEDHSDQLKEIQRIATKVFNRFEKEKRISHRMNKDAVEDIEYILVKCLYLIGDLSLSRSDIKQTLLDHYDLAFAKSPAMGKKLFNEHYYGLHKPYDKLKETIWKLVFILGEYKEKTFKR